MPQRVVIAICKEGPDSQGHRLARTIADHDSLTTRYEIYLALERDTSQTIAPGGTGFGGKVFEESAPVIHQNARILAAAEGKCPIADDDFFLEAR